MPPSRETCLYPGKCTNHPGKRAPIPGNVPTESRAVKKCRLNKIPAAVFCRSKFLKMPAEHPYAHVPQLYPHLTLWQQESLLCFPTVSASLLACSKAHPDNKLPCQVVRKLAVFKIPEGSSIPEGSKNTGRFQKYRKVPQNTMIFSECNAKSLLNPLLMKMLEGSQMAKIPEGFQNTGRFQKFCKVPNNTGRIPEIR